jgi:hypothetical protein
VINDACGQVFREPTHEECAARAEVRLTDDLTGRAAYYPQMGGYVSRCVVVMDHGCVDVYVWHNGDFPFSGHDSWGEAQSPAVLHHCDGGQFIRFGEFVADLQGEEAERCDTP